MMTRRILQPVEQVDGLTTGDFWRDRDRSFRDERDDRISRAVCPSGPGLPSSWSRSYAGLRFMVDRCPGVGPKRPDFGYSDFDVEFDAN